MIFAQLGPHQKWLLALRRSKRSGAFLKYNIKPSEINSLISKFRKSIRSGPIHLTTEEQEILEILPYADHLASPVTSSEVRHLPLTPAQERILDKEAGTRWRNQVIYSARSKE